MALAAIARAPCRFALAPYCFALAPSDSRSRSANRADLDRIGHGLLEQAFRTGGRRNDQCLDLAGCEHRQAQIDRAAAADDYIQRRRRFAQRFAQAPIVIRERGKNGFGRPHVAAVDAQRTRTDDHHIGNGAQQPHHHAILGAEPADVPAAGVPLRIERDDAVERGHKIAEHMWPRTRQRHAQASVQTREPWRQRQHLAALRFEKRLERRERCRTGAGHGVSLRTSWNLQPGRSMSSGLTAASSRSRIRRIRSACLASMPLRSLLVKKRSSPCAVTPDHRSK